MAIGWIKVENSLPSKPEIWSIANALDMDPDAVVGKVIRVWIWFDEQSRDGHAPSVTKKLLDRDVGVTGFCDSMIIAGWLIEKNDEITVPNFDYHNSQTAKTRAMATKRKQLERSRKCHDKSVTKTRPEKRREEKSIKKSKQKKPVTPMPKDFGISDRVKQWAAKNGHNHLEQHLESFKLKCGAKDYRYADWDLAFMNAVRDNWAKIGDLFDKQEPRSRLREL